MDDADYISEFEELLKLKDFSKNSKMKMPFDCTYECIAKALQDEYTENINEKINRWANVTHIIYFKNVKSVEYYFQAKMLYRDGFYEASIILSRTVCELICYDMLSKISHPFGTISSIEVPAFRVFVDFLAIPKSIEKNIFNSEILRKININNDKNFVKSSYYLNKLTNNYDFKIECGKKRNNLQRLFKIFNSLDFNAMDNFRNDIYSCLHDLYDICNLYAHAKGNSSKKDATQCLNMLAHILSEIYAVDKLENKTIKSGYSNFPDICNGMNFAITCATTPNEAQRVYLNLPSQQHFGLMKQTVGTWQGKWKDKKGKMVTGTLSLFWETSEHLNAKIRYKKDDGLEKIEPLEIKLFGNYFHLIGFNEKDMKHRKGKHVFFELEFFNDDLLLGQHVDNKAKAIFKRIE